MLLPIHGVVGLRATVLTIPVHVPPADEQAPLPIHGAHGAHGARAIPLIIQGHVLVLLVGVVSQKVLHTPGAAGHRAMLQPIPVHVAPAGARAL